MGHQTSCLGKLLRLLLNRSTQFRDRRVQPIQQLQQIASSPAGPRSQAEGLQLLPSVFAPQPLLAAQAFVQRHRLQLVHDPRARLHHAMPVPQQLPQIPILPARYPDLREAIFQHQLQNQLRILAIRLLLAYSLRPDLRCISDPQLEVELREQSLKPTCLSTGLHPDTHLHSLGREIAIKLFRFLTVLQSPFLKLPSVGIHKRNLLKARVIICSYNDHVRLLSPEPVGWIQHHQLYSSVGADIVMESITLKTPSMSEMAWLHHLPSIRCVWEIECQRSIGHGRRAWFDFPRARNRLQLD